MGKESRGAFHGRRGKEQPVQEQEAQKYQEEGSFCRGA